MSKTIEEIKLYLQEKRLDAIEEETECSEKNSYYAGMLYGGRDFAERMLEWIEED